MVVGGDGGGDIGFGDVGGAGVVRVVAFVVEVVGSVVGWVAVYEVRLMTPSRAHSH